MTFEPEEVKRALEEAAMAKHDDMAHPAKRELVEQIRLAVEDWGYPTFLRALNHVVGHDEPGSLTLDRLFTKLNVLCGWADEQEDL